MGDGHFVGYPIILLLVLMYTTEAHQGLLQPVCVAAGQLEFYRYTIYGGAITTLLAVLLIPRMGMLGAAIAMLVGQLSTQNWAIPLMTYRIIRVTVTEGLRLVVPHALGYGFLLFIMIIVLKYAIGNLTVALFISGAVALLLLSFPLRSLLLSARRSATSLV